MATLQDRWLKQHAAGERKLAKVLRKFFKAQTARVVDAARGLSALPPDVAPKLLKPADETKILLAAVSDEIISMMATGAADVLAQAKKPKSSKAFEWNDFELPKNVKDEITAAFIQLEEQPYWQEIQTTTSGIITDVLQASLEEGLTLDGIVERLANDLGITNEVRAMAIARTESTGAYNGGHQASYASLAADGLISGKQWLGVSDEDQRGTHNDADGQEVGPTEDFTVGGETCPYPGWHGLPAKERCNCRCSTAGIFSE